MVLLDEVGRGTSTFDGLAIAWSVTEDLARELVKVIIATHYHQLIGLEGEIDSLFNIHVQVAEIDRELTSYILFLMGPVMIHMESKLHLLQDCLLRIERARDLLIFLEQQAEGAEPGKVFHFQDQMGNLLYLDGWSTNSQVQMKHLALMYQPCQPSRKIC